MRDNKEITTIFDPRRTGASGSGPSSSGGPRRPPPSVVIVTAPPQDNPAPPADPPAGDNTMPNGPSLSAPPPGPHGPQVLAPPSQSAMNPSQAGGVPACPGSCNAQGGYNFDDELTYIFQKFLLIIKRSRLIANRSISWLSMVYDIFHVALDRLDGKLYGDFWLAQWKAECTRTRISYRVIYN
ncbi:hypothetical protein J437_LFUL009741 [Ladona fulva]|uniref:Uncharacterized protein n=1 Tax=Ladona fulva TaxID=123851 RepID=A0A8K0P2S6_LADFU|nr:hypothetical protein J437_LFUL009741 [Ladona fulva]